MTKLPVKFCFLSLLLPLLLVISGCNTPPGMLTAKNTYTDPLKARAENFASNNDYQAAAQVYLNQSAGLSSEQTADYRLSAIDYLIRGHQWDNAESVLASIQTKSLPPEIKDRYLFLLARIKLAQNNPEKTLETLSKISLPEALPEGGLYYYRLNAAANQAAGNTKAAIQQLVWLDVLITDPKERKNNQNAIWQQLSSLPDDELKDIQTHINSDSFGGWSELAYQIRANRYTSQGTLVTITQWQSQHPQHSANEHIIPELTATLPVTDMRDKNIALLLPLSGRTAKKAQAIQDAILAAHKQNSMNHLPLKTYDTTNGIESIGEIYQRAVNDGADFIIGPLLKSHIRNLASSTRLQTPVLALNHIKDSIGFSQPLYQFGLDPEDEARQTAERARLDGHQRIVALVPDSQWGERVLAAFADSWQEAGGELMGVERYPARTTDFSQYIQRILNLDSSKYRHRLLQNRLGQKLEFETRRRKDVDAVFIVAFPREGRQIKPQLRFHHASNLTVYATSHIYSGVPDPAKDRDLNGIRFCDIPWTLGTTGESALRQQLESNWGKRADHYQRLFALGIDAYRLIPWLESSASVNQTGYTGTTGILTLDAQRQIHRRLDCAQFRTGLPDTLGTLPVSAFDEPSQAIPPPGRMLHWSTDQ